MDSDLFRRVNDVIDHLRGSAEDILNAFDIAIENGKISQEEWRLHEAEILDRVDNEIFTCTVCGWTLNVDEMGEDTDSGELQCEKCAEE